MQKNLLDEAPRYLELKNKILREGDLSETEWDEFLSLEEQMQESKSDKEAWEALLFESQIDPAFSTNEQFAPKTEPRPLPAIVITSTAWLKNLMTGSRLAYPATALTAVIVSFFMFIHPWKEQEAIRQFSDNKKLPQTIVPQQPSVENFKSIPLSALSKKNKDNDSYALNPYLDEFIGDNLRDGSVSIELTIPENGFILGRHSKEIIFTGKVVSDVPIQYNQLGLKIYSNKTEDFSNDKFISYEETSIDSAGTFNFSTPNKFEKGLYYYVIETQGNSAVKHVGKFTVK